jgi:hypothetical protein
MTKQIVEEINLEDEEENPDALDKGEKVESDDLYSDF